MSVEPSQLLTSTMRVHGNAPSLVYDFLVTDSLLNKIQGIRVDLIINRKLLASTPAGGAGNVQIVVSQRRAGRFMWNAGGLAGQQTQTVRVDILVRHLENPANPTTARDVADGIRRHIQQLMFNKTWLGVGWLGHTESDSGYPSAPVARIAYAYIQYDFLMSMGN